jgi:hypothetical protein
MNLFASLMRTLVPVVAGLLLGLAARAGLDVDGETATLVVTSALTAGYYALFRGLEAAAGHLGWEPLRVAAGVLLGWARPPQYAQPITAPVRVRLDTDDLGRQLAAAYAKARE